MAEQRLHSGLGPIDILTRVELEEGLHKEFGVALRDRYRGVETARIPPIMAVSTGGTLNLGIEGLSDGDAGPEQGDIWMLRRANVTSSAFATDQARYVLFRGSTPSDTANAFTNRFLLDGQSFQAASTFTTFTQPAVPASTVAAQNQSNQVYQVVVTGGAVTQVFVNGVQVGSGDGTYFVPAFGSISVTYSAAPTWTWTTTQASTAFQLGQNQGIAYNPGTKYPVLQPGEQVYAQVFNTTAGFTYLLSGEAIRVPAEMKGKVL
jgi:hypothetical protein